MTATSSLTRLVSWSSCLAVAVTTLATLSLTSASGAMVEAEGRRPGVALERSARSLDWRRCDPGPLRAAGAQCSNLRVPLDYDNPGEGSVRLAVARLRGGDPGPRRVLVVNYGGPGNPSREAILAVAGGLGSAASRFDIVAVDQRAAGGSSPRSCGDGSLWQQSAGPNRASFAESVQAARRLARRCRAALGRLATNSGSTTLASDIDAVRVALGAGQIDYLGYSYGSYLGAVYAHRFPEHVRRVVLDSVVDPDTFPTGLFAAQAPAQQRAFRSWSEWTAHHHATYRLGRTPARVRRVVLRLNAAVGRAPLTRSGFRIDEHSFPVLVRLGLGSGSQNAGLARSVQALRAQWRGRPAPKTPFLDLLLATMGSPQAAEFNAANLATLCSDGGFGSDPQSYLRQIRAHEDRFPLFAGLDHNITPCAFWAAGPGEAALRVDSDVPAMLVQARSDINTPASGARAMAAHLRDPALVTLNIRRHALFGMVPSRCVDRAVTRFLLRGAGAGERRRC